jgi:archaeal flagellin FlaB
MGIGAMIVFVAMVLVAGIAAYSVLQVASQLESTSQSTGEQTISEVSTGVRVLTVEGHNTAGLIDQLVLIVAPRPGSPEVDLGVTQVELSDTTTKCLLKYDAGSFADATTGTSDVFSEAAFPATGGLFGVIVLKDDDGSCTSTHPVVNRGDNVMLAVNTDACFGGIGGSAMIIGNVIPENGAWAIVSFRTPSVFADSVVILQQ